MIAIRRVHCGTIEGERGVLNSSQQCTDCLLQLIVEHFLLHCNGMAEERKKMVRVLNEIMEGW